MSTARMVACTSRRSSNFLVSALVHDVEDALDAALDAAVDEVLAEVRQLLEVAVLYSTWLGSPSGPAPWPRWRGSASRCYSAHPHTTGHRYR